MTSHRSGTINSNGPRSVMEQTANTGLFAVRKHLRRTTNPAMRPSAYVVSAPQEHFELRFGSALLI